jgi:hypothetical protein
MSHDQFAFPDMLEEMDAAERAKLDAHRTKVQAWFDALAPEQKRQLGEWMYGPEWQTCQALSAAACDFYRSQPRHLQVGGANGTTHQELARCARISICRRPTST